MSSLSLRQLADGPDAFLALDTETRLLLRNSAAESLVQRLFQVYLEDGAARPLRESLLCAEAEPLFAACERALAGEEPVRSEFQFPGSGFWLEFRAYPAPHGLSVFLRDITLPKQAEEVSRRQTRERSTPLPAPAGGERDAERFQVVVENLLECLGLYSAVRDETGQILDFRVEYVNDQACRNNNLTREQQLGKLLGELLPGHHASGLIAEYARVVETGEPLHKEELVYEDVYGEQRLTRAFDLRVAKLGDGFLATWREITERRAFQDTLQRSEGRLQAVLEQMPSGLVIAEAPDGRISAYNAEAERILGHPLLPAAEIQEYDQYRAVHPDGRSYLPEEYPTARALLHGELIRNEIMLYRQESGATREISVNAAPVRDAAGEITACVCTFHDVSGLRRAEAALAESEERRSAALAASETGTFRWDLATNSLDWDENLDRLFGLQPGHTARSLDAFIQLVHPEDREEVIARCAQCASTGADFEMEFRTVWPDGTLRWLYDKGKTFLDAEGKPAYMAGACVDVTKRKLTEQALRESEQRLRTIEESIPQMVWVTRPDGWHEHYNQRWYDYTGLTPDETRGWGWSRPLHPDDQARSEARWKLATDSGEPYEIEYRLRGADGCYRWFLGRALPLRNGAGEITRWFGTCTDIHDQKLAQEERAQILAREQQRSRQLRLLAQAALDVNAAPSLPEMLHTVTEQACAIVGTALAVTSTIPEEDWDQATHVVQAAEAYTAWNDPTLRLTSTGVSADAFRQNRVKRLREEKLRNREGATGFAVESGLALPTDGWLVAPLLARNGRRLGVLQLSGKAEGEFTDDDVLLLLQLAQMAAVAIEKAQLYEEIRRSDQAKTEFLAMLAHELRNPLSPIMTAALVIRARPGSDAALRALSVIERQAAQLTRLVEDLLDVSRITRGKIELRLEPVRLSQIVEQATEAVRPLMESRKHRLEVTTDPATWLRADSARLVQVLTNLLHNAAKYTDPGGIVQVSVRREDERALIQVSDSGIGITAADLPYIFDLFAQVDRDVSRSQGGLGIGLTMVQNLVKLHGGTVTATSSGRGKGSLFTVSLPLSPDPTLPPEQAGQSVERKRRERRRIVVVEDNRDAAETLADLLQLWGHEPQIAHDGNEGLDLILRERPEVAFLDIGLPGMDGYEIARRLRREPVLEGLLLIALTGYGQEEDRRRALEAGFDHHHTKPVKPEVLRKLLEP